MEMLNTIIKLAHEFGTDDYVKGGGGNVSAKNAETMWVKPSGTTLSGLTAQSLIAMDRRKLGVFYMMDLPANPTVREAVAKDVMAAAVLPGQSGRASVEAPLHDIMSGVFVVHTHPPLVNGMTCARDGAAVCARLFPDALWVPYVDPGITLCMEVRSRYRGERLVLLENHGIFVAGDSEAEVRGIYARVLDCLREEYARAGISTTLAADIPDVPAPVTPDHIVYGRKPKLGPVMAADAELIRQLAEAFGGMKILDDRARHFIETWEVESYRQQQIN